MKNRSIIHVVVIVSMARQLDVSADAATPPNSYDEALTLARACMNAEDLYQRAALLKQAIAWGERLDDIAFALRPEPPKGAKTGYLAYDRFTVPRLRKQLDRLLPRLPGPVPEKAKTEIKDGMFRVLATNGSVLWTRPYPDPAGPIPQLISRDPEIHNTAFRLRYSALGVAAGPQGIPSPADEFLNFVFVPTDYDPAKAYSLVIDLHGGAGSDTLDQGAARSQAIVDFTLNQRCQDVIRVNLGAPKYAPLKWTFPESEIHLQAVIEEYSTRYHIDPNRICLTGPSMGGIGGWWHAFRIGDRFAMIRPVVGNYIQAYWPKLRGTFLYFTNGVFDSGNTRVDWARLAHRRLSDLGIEHLDGEVPDGHVPAGAGPLELTVEELIRTRCRNPYPSRVCAVSPFTPKSPPGSPIYLGTPEQDRARFPHQPYSFWVSIKETGPSGVVVEQFDTVSRYPQHFALGHELMPAGAADAENLGDNRFRVHTTNVRRFSLWLHPKMGIDFSRPIEIEVIEKDVDPTTFVEREIGRRKLQMAAKPSLADMLEYLSDRRDYGLIYHSRLDVDVR